MKKLREYIRPLPYFWLLGLTGIVGTMVGFRGDLTSSAGPLVIAFLIGVSIGGIIFLFEHKKYLQCEDRTNYRISRWPIGMFFLIMFVVAFLKNEGKGYAILCASSYVISLTTILTALQLSKKWTLDWSNLR